MWAEVMSATFYRTEFTPLSFLRRSAYMFPDKTAVVAIPVETWGERQKAFVTLKKEKEATEFCKERVARFKAPAATVEFGELTKTSTGKVQKYVLRAKEWMGRDSKAGGYEVF